MHAIDATQHVIDMHTAEHFLQGRTRKLISAVPFLSVRACCIAVVTSTDLSNIKDLLVFPELRSLDRHDHVPVAACALFRVAIAGPGVVWGVAVVESVHQQQ
jgi:hypothetical protein